MSRDENFSSSLRRALKLSSKRASSVRLVLLLVPFRQLSLPPTGAPDDPGHPPDESHDRARASGPRHNASSNPPGGSPRGAGARPLPATPRVRSRGLAPARKDAPITLRSLWPRWMLTEWCVGHGTAVLAPADLPVGYPAGITTSADKRRNAYFIAVS